MLLKDFIEKVNSVIEKVEFDKYFYWFIQKFDLNDKAKLLNLKKDNNLHSIRPRKGDIYLIDFGQNIGNELCNTHMGIIIQDSLKNSISSTTIVIPISSSPKLYDTHEKIVESDILVGKLNKLPSKAKVEQIMCIDKARLIHKIGQVTPSFINRLEKRILKILDIKKE